MGKACPDLPTSSTCPAAELPASAATADLPASAEIPASGLCSSAADGRPGHRLWRKPVQPDQLQQQLCPVRRPVWRFGARGARRRPAFESDLLPAAADGDETAAFHCFWFDCSARRLCLRPLVRPVPVLSPIIIYLSNL